MTNGKPLSVTAATLIAAGALSACGSSSGSNSTSSTASSSSSASGQQVAVTEPWVRATAPSAMTAAVYMTLKSEAGNALMGATVPSTIAGSVQLHKTTATSGTSTTKMSGGSTTSMSHTSTTSMLGMKQVMSIPLPAGKSVQLAPGGYHIMLMNLAKPITSGEQIPVTLKFAKGAAMTVTVLGRSG